MKRIAVAKILSLAASVLGCIFLVTLFTEETTALSALASVLTPLLSLVCYIMCGFFKAIATPFSAAKWGFIMAPFPANLVAVLLMFVLGCISALYIPVVPVFKRAAELGC